MIMVHPITKDAHNYLFLAFVCPYKIVDLFFFNTATFMVNYLVINVVVLN